MEDRLSQIPSVETLYHYALRIVRKVL